MRRLSRTAYFDIVPRMAPRIHMPHWPTPLATDAPGTALMRTQALLDKLGNPERRLPPAVHVAGTNGKGSTIAFLRAMLEAAGYRCHVYTSPHLARFHERIVLGGRTIDDATLHYVLEAARIANNNAPITFFEGTTAAAWLAFAEHPADIVLVETGMGGALDPTNSLTTTCLSIITAISFDHKEFLGNTLAAIARHKAGIMRPRIPCVVGAQPDAAAAALAEIAAALPTPLYRHGREWAAAEHAGQLVFEDIHGQVLLPAPGLFGAHQYSNAGNAIAAATLLPELLPEFDIDETAIRRGLAEVRWPGRLERITTGPLAAMLTEGAELWYDGGHNPAAGEALAHTLATWKAQDGHPLYVIFGTTQGKALEEILAPLAPHTTLLLGVEVTAEPRSYPADAVAHAATRSGIPATACPTLADAITHALNHAAATHAARPPRILVFGSLFLRIMLEVEEKL